MSGPVAHVDDEEKTAQHSVEERYSSLESLSCSEREGHSTVTDGEDARNSKDIGCYRTGEKIFPNGDLYTGSLRGNLPDGPGKYLWSDGCMYEGQWVRGKKTGWGKISWPSGATYEGDFLGEYMHGVGTYTGIDGTTYKGDWSLNVKHGLGKKRYPNGDCYEGSWNQGMPEGPGRYSWENGNVYLGDWKGGKMCGKGVLTWANGDSFDGFWLDGVVHGFGVYTWADGGCYVGTWSRGLKDGKGSFYPLGSKLPIFHGGWRNSVGKGGQEANTAQRPVNHGSSRLGHASSLDLGQFKMRRFRRANRNSSDKLLTDEVTNSSDYARNRNVSLQRRWSLEGALENVIGQDGVWTAGEPILECDENENDDISKPVLEREYVQGVLINELVKDNRFAMPSKSTRRRQKRQEVKKPGETIIKGHRSYDLMLNLQLGIRYTVGKITPIPRREVRSSDFGPRARIWMKFPREGSQLTPPHQSVDFKWKDYCPMVFRNLREMFKIDAADYMMSICGSAALRELSSPGKSGSVFYLSQDDRFMIKTLRKSEVQVLLRMLPNYHHHVRMRENTLITKFFGLHRIKPAGGQKVRFVVMGNMFCTELRIHRRFDLKGSSQGRSTDKIEIDETTTLKDLDLDYVFHLEPSWREALLKQIEVDCMFLESQRIMDYSLLLGLHFRAPQYLKSHVSDPQSVNSEDSGNLADEVAAAVEDEIACYPQSLILVAREPHQDGTILGSHIRGSPLRASAIGDEEVDLLLPGTARLRIQLGVNMPARADRRPQRDKDHNEDQLFNEVYDVVLYLGIIDILQEYNFSKKLEHALKAFQFDSSSISAVEPALYSKRFLAFIQKVFPPNP
ncbi:hypothetical protein SUGI_1196660 [Cryptomeria japonica]|nr:phosphatidylinositol 4-phosphate 5-kinase 9-like isoform X2 [Cryptomeria japonica]GLJ55708.1 hypothetical protein SUGI_1196660 [Cryptomeria japonica]